MKRPIYNWLTLKDNFLSIKLIYQLPLNNNDETKSNETNSLADLLVGKIDVLLEISKWVEILYKVQKMIFSNFQLDKIEKIDFKDEKDIVKGTKNIIDKVTKKFKKGQKFWPKLTQFQTLFYNIVLRLNWDSVKVVLANKDVF